MNFGDFSGRNNILETDVLVGHRGTTTVSNVKPESSWTYGVLKAWLETLFVPLAQKGVADGVATLDSNGIVPASQLPSGISAVVQTALNLKADSSTVNAALALKADVSALNSLSATVTGLTTSKADASTVTTLSNTVTSLTSTVNGKLNSSALTQTVTTSTTTVPSEGAVKAYVDAAVQAYSGIANKETINTGVTHGLSAGTAIYNDNGTWKYAKADNRFTCSGIAYLENVPSATTLTVVYGGRTTVSGKTPNTQYYLSDATAGLITDTPPTAVTSFIVPIYRTGTSSNAIVEIDDPQSLAKLEPTDIRLATDANASSPADTEIFSQKATADRIDTKIAAALTALGAGDLPGYYKIWLRSDVANLPATWLQLDGSNGQATVADVGDVMFARIGNGTVATPSISPAAGTYGSAQSVTITCATAGATIRYTTNGSTPSRSVGTVYSGGFTISDSQTIKAIAYKDLYKDSSVASNAYVITGVGPVLTSATIASDGSTWTLVFSAAVSIGAGGGGGLVATIPTGNANLTVTAGTGTNTLTATGSANAYGGQTVTLAYTQPGNGLEATADAVDVSTFTGVAVTNNSTQVSYLLTENFEGPGYENVWTESGTGIDPSYATSPAPLVGSRSIRINTTGVTNTYAAFTGQSTAEAYAILRHQSGTTYRVFSLTDSSGVLLATVIRETSGHLTIRCGTTGGTTTTGTAPFDTATTLHVWVRYVKGTGANGFASIAVSTDGTRPSSGDWYKEHTTGNATANAARIMLGNTVATTYSFIADKVRVSDGTIPSNPS